MPPESEERPNAERLQVAIEALERDLTAASLEKQKNGRVRARRLTKLELGYTLQDLFLLDAPITIGIPDEVDAGSFDTVGANQRISAIHMESYLNAADIALDQAIRLGPNPYRDFGDYADTNFAHLEMWHETELKQGGSLTRKLKYGNGIALFKDNDYIVTFHHDIPRQGIYRLTAKLAAYQTKLPVTAKIIVKSQSGSAQLAKTVDLSPGPAVIVSVETLMKPGDRPYLTFHSGKSTEIYATGAKHYKGPGLAILSQKVEGPISQSWPTPGTKKLLDGLSIVSVGDSNGPFRVKGSGDSLDDVRQLARRLAPQIFRQKTSDEEIESFVELARPAIDEGRDFVDALKIVLRSMLSAPQFLLLQNADSKNADSTNAVSTNTDHALASRLSYFLWRSIPDDELLTLARDGKLSDPDTLKKQVDRMLADKKSKRFVNDFVGQWLRLNKIDATSPDDGLYPEFDELLGNALPQETRLFFANLIDENLSASNLIDSDFTFLNRRLAEHYGIKGIQGQDFQRVELPPDSPRGGVLTQAAVLKTTANGTTTSPVTRGNFVLTNFLGTPPSPPPPNVGSIEPDTRGKTSIREILLAHRENESCNQCHQEIDPPGFALECFDPIGGFRKRYRKSRGEATFGDYTVKLPPAQGLPVDASGTTASGDAFSGIAEFKQLLLADQELVISNFISQLIVFSTGGEIQFADRAVIDEILASTRKANFPVRDIIHAVVQSRLFKQP